MNVQQVCERFNAPSEMGLQRLRYAGITADGGTMIRVLATAKGKTPIDIANVIVEKDGALTAPGEYRPNDGRDGRSGKYFRAA